MGRPGDKKLEGTQAPSVTLEKIAPPEIQVGKAAKFGIVVRNVGPVEAADVEVIDAVPQGTQLLGTTPKANVGPRGEIVWKLGNMKSGDESKLEVEVMPVTEGEIGSVAVVQFRSTASVRTVATKPELVLELNSPPQVMIGGDATIGIKLSNPGTGAAEKVVLSEKVPAGLQHPAGSELEFEVGTLKPGETRQLDLTLHAVQAGKFANKLVVEGDANLHTEQTANIEVIAPALSVALNGPGLRYLDRQAKYTVSITNPGTAPAKDVDLVTQLPKGMQFVDASDSGHYDSNSHSVVWSLAELPAGAIGQRHADRIGQGARRTEIPHRRTRHRRPERRERASDRGRRRGGRAVHRGRRRGPRGSGRPGHVRNPRGQSGLQSGQSRASGRAIAAGNEAHRRRRAGQVRHGRPARGVRAAGAPGPQSRRYLQGGRHNVCRPAICA